MSDDEVVVQFLGTGDAFGSGGRLQTCIFVEAANERFLLDCGASALISLKRWAVAPNLVEAILVTHLHGDHFGGIPFFILDAQLVSKRSSPLVIAGPPGVEARVREAQEILFPGSSTMSLKFQVSYVELAEREPTSIGRLTVTAYPVVHASGAPAYGLRVTCDRRVIAYSGDTEWTDALVEVARGADLFICEAYFYDKKVRYHLDYESLMAHRPDLDCRRLILTHMSDELLGRLGDIQAETAEDGQRIII